MMATLTAIGPGMVENQVCTRFLVPGSAAPSASGSGSSASRSSTSVLSVDVLSVDVLSVDGVLVDELRDVYGFGFFGGTIMLCHVLPFEVKARSDSL